MVTDPGRIGFLGAGHMGSAMIARLCAAGLSVVAYDRSPAALAAVAAAGAVAADDAAAVAGAATIICCSLPSSAVFADVAERVLVPAARPGLLVVDFGTTTTATTRRIAATLTAAGAGLIDAPVSGDPRSDGLRIFIGGAADDVARCRPLFAALAHASRAVHVGPVGSGQVVKGVNQLAMGLVQAAYLEAIAYGVDSGVEAEVIARAVGGEDGFRREVAVLAARIAAGEGEALDAKHAELPYFLEHAAAAGLPMPLTAALAGFLADAPRDARDNMGRPYAPFWRSLRR